MYPMKIMKELLVEIPVIKNQPKIETYKKEIQLFHNFL